MSIVAILGVVLIVTIVLAIRQRAVRDPREISLKRRIRF